MPDPAEIGNYAAKALKNHKTSFIVWQRDGLVLATNPQFYRLTGYSPQDTKTMRWPGNFTSEDSRISIQSQMNALDIGEEEQRLVEFIIRKDGTALPVALDMGSYRFGGSEMPVYLAFMDDITENKRIMDELLNSKVAIDLFSDPSLWLDEQGRFIYVNRSASDSLGFSENELKSMYIWEVDQEFTPEKYHKLWADIKAAGWLRFETIHRTKDGRTFPVEVNSSYIKVGDRELIISFDRDITERKRAEEAIRESEELFRVLASTSLAAIYLVQNDKFIYANPQGLDLLGYSYNELIGTNFWEPVHPEFKEGMKKYGELLLKGEHIPGRFEIKFLRKNGEEGWADVIVAPIKYRGHAAGVITALNITYRKKSEIALKESEEKFRVLSEMSPTAIFMYQGDKLIYANPSAENFTGYSKEEIRRKEFWEMVHPRYQEVVKQYGLARQKGEPVPNRYEIMYITKGGETRWAQFTAGEIEYMRKPAGIVTAIDTTERKQAEIDLNSAKLEAELYVDLMGHDINNMNQIALGFLEIVQGKLNFGGNIESSDLQLISGAIESLKSSSSLIATVRKLQKERIGGYIPQIIDVNEILSDIQAHFARIPDRNIRIEILSKSGCRVKANELLKDVFVNIIGNAIKHSRGDLAIFISIRHTVENNHGCCRVEIEDTGPGIPDDRKKAIFDRSAKDTGKLTGKGLGLYLVRTLVDDFHGRIWVEDRIPGDYRKGCRFIIMLPAGNGKPETVSEAKA